FKPFDQEAIAECLAKAFEGLTLAKDAQAVPLREAFLQRLATEQRAWLDELAPLQISWHDDRKLKLLYAGSERDALAQPGPPELQVKLHECFKLSAHPQICEGRLPVKLWLCAPDGKRLDATSDWPAFRTTAYPKLKPVLQKKYPGVLWL